MGDSVKRKIERPFEQIAGGLESGFEKIGRGVKKIDKPIRKGATAAKRTAAADIAKQQQLEKLRVAEGESEIATRRAQAGNKGGRKSLIKSAAGGLSANLGGTL